MRTRGAGLRCRLTCLSGRATILRSSPSSSVARCSNLGRRAIGCNSCGVVFRGICSRLFSGLRYRLALLKRLVQAIERERDGAEINLAGRIVLRQSALRHRRAVFTGYREGELASDVRRLKALFRFKHLHAGKANGNRIGAVRIFELQAVTQVRRCSKRAVAVIDNRNRKRNRLRLRGHTNSRQAVGLLVRRISNGPATIGILRGLAILNQLGKQLGTVAQLAKRNGAIGGVLRRKQIVTAGSVLHRKGELTLCKVAAAQCLRACDTLRKATFCLVGVHERNGCHSCFIGTIGERLGAFRAARYRSGYHEFGSGRVVRNRYGYRALGSIVGIAIGSGALLSHLIGVCFAHVVLAEHHVAIQHLLDNLHAVGRGRHGNDLATCGQVKRIR